MFLCAKIDCTFVGANKYE